MRHGSHPAADDHPRLCRGRCGPAQRPGQRRRAGAHLLRPVPAGGAGRGRLRRHAGAGLGAVSLPRGRFVVGCGGIVAGRGLCADCRAMGFLHPPLGYAAAPRPAPVPQGKPLQRGADGLSAPSAGSGGRGMPCGCGPLCGGRQRMLSPGHPPALCRKAPAQRLYPPGLLLWPVGFFP